MQTLLSIKFMNPSQKINAFLQKRGYDLKKVKGQEVNNANIISKALTKDDALEALHLWLEELHHPILPILCQDGIMFILILLYVSFCFHF